MANRAQDWLAQAQRDLEHARLDLGASFHEWACFSAHQAAEKALKALFQHLNGEAWGHSVKRFLDELTPSIEGTAELLDCARILDRYYIPTRYPNGFDYGIPADYYTETDSRQAIDCAEAILRLCASRLSE